MAIKTQKGRDLEEFTARGRGTPSLRVGELIPEPDSLGEPSTIVLLRKDVRNQLRQTQSIVLPDGTEASASQFTEDGNLKNTENSATLAELWEDFVGPEARLEIVLPFLTELFPDKAVSIFESAAGLGIEAAALASAGYKVTANECDSEFLALMNARFTRLEVMGLIESVEATNWRDLDNTSRPGANFGHVMCMGNSIAYEHRDQAIRKIVENLHYVTAPGQKLAIDERNWPMILENYVKKMKGLPMPHQSGAPMYNGTNVVGDPVAYDPKTKLMTFEYRRADIECEMKSKVGRLVMCAFERDQLLVHLREVFGRENVQCFSDFTSLPEKESDRHQYLGDVKPGFLQYVCTKPA